MKRFPIFLCFFLFPIFLDAATVAFTVDPSQNNSPISPLTYGSNSAIPNVKNTWYRSGGNRLTAYNWETNWSNAGSDYLYENDTLLGDTALGPAGAFTTFEAQNKAAGADSLVTLQLAGYVSADKAGPVAAGQYAPSSRFLPIQFLKGAPFSMTPSTTDGVVYMDECVNFLVQTLGTAAAGGIKFYDLDNEPGAWSSVHPEVHSAKATYAEVAGKGITVASIVTGLDPSAQVLGPVGYGWGDFINLSSAPDAATYSSYDNGNWVPFLNYYLAQMKAASTTAGHRLLNYLDSHVYSEGTDAAGNRVNTSDVSQDAATTRMQLPREMWDPTFTENSWISCCVPNYGPMTLIPRLQAAVSQYYPGTKIAFTEYDYGGGGDVSGGIAQADALGVFGKYGVMASIWDLGTGDQYLTAAFNLFLNYDGSGSQFGDTSILANSNNVPEATVYAAKDNSHPDRLNVIVLNKDYSANNTASVTLSNLAGGQQISSIRAFRFDSAISVISASTAPAFTTNTFTDTLPFRSATLYEITLSQGFITFTPTVSSTAMNSPTLTATATRTFTATPSPTGTLATPTFTSTKTSTPTVTFTATPTVVCAQLFNGCESLTENGNWTGTNATRAVVTSATAPLGSITQLTHALQVNVTTGATWNDQMFNLDTFSPSDFTGVSQLKLDLYVPAGLLTGTSYNNLYLFASSAAVGENSISNDGPSLVAGENTDLTFNINFGAGAITPGSALIKLYFIFNSDKTNTGTLYVDNIRLVKSCAVTPTFTPMVSTATSTATKTMTPTASLTASRTATPTSSSTPTPSGTFTASLTGTYTRTFSPTITSTPTFSLSPTPTQTTSFTSSPTMTPSATFTASLTGTYTRTFSPTMTSTPTFTLSPTPTQTATESPTITQTPTGTWDTATWSPTPSPTPTNSPTPSNSATPSRTPSSTASFTATTTASPTQSLTSTWSATPSRTVTSTLTSTPTPTGTYTSAATSTSTKTYTSTATWTPTWSVTPSPTFTSTLTPTRTFTSTTTATPSITLTPALTATPSTVNLPFPNPDNGIQPISFYYNLGAGVQSVKLKLFTTAFRKIYEDDSLPTSSGTHLYSLDWEKAGLTPANGLYYLVLTQDPAGHSPQIVMKILILR